jgi:uncharacterized membrane protein YebE (DUF533 family)
MRKRAEKLLANTDAQSSQPLESEHKQIRKILAPAVGHCDVCDCTDLDGDHRANAEVRAVREVQALIAAARVSGGLAEAKKLYGEIMNSFEDSETEWEIRKLLERHISEYEAINQEDKQ